MTSSANRLLLLLGLVGVGCQGLRMNDLHRTPMQAAWAVSGGNPARVNAADVVLPTTLVPVWTYNAEAGFGPASPILAGDAILVATRKGDLHAIGLERGNRIGYVSMGGSVEGAIALENESIFGATAIGRRPLFRYSLREGRMVWRVATPPILSGVLVTEGLVVVADAEGQVAAFDTRQGTPRWTFTPDAPTTYRAAPVLAASGVLVADDHGQVRLLDLQTGAVRWTRAVSGPVYTTPAVSDSIAFVSSTRGTLVALRIRDGGVIWQHVLPDATVRLSAPATLDAHVVVAGTDRRVRLLDAETGEVQWEVELDDALVAAPLLTRNTVFVGTMGERLLALSRTDGRVQGSYELKGRMKSAMAVAEESVIVLSEPRYVYRFAAPSEDTP